MRRVHEEEGRAGRLLAWLVHPHIVRNPITEITLSDGSLVHEPLGINAAFHDYYLALYAYPETPLADTLDDLLTGMQLITLTEENAALLGAEVTEDEVKLAIKDLATAMYVEAYGLGLLPVMLREVLVVPLPKTTDRHAGVKDFRPLFMLNTDFIIPSHQAPAAYAEPDP
ncbi:hypothetical protein NDU88_001773 [Pleurodeles waltl]|uniref:Uncharacterized protein n=1 Tax=Pleurodeles waltl TaxID=8319 RepID=A0AAV7V8R6_PLEWA|nr:hypothetical protein NDU88_001773 [Pleurodeles waltl]